MGVWYYKIQHGKVLRKHIDDTGTSKEDCARTLELIRECCEEVIKAPELQKDEFDDARRAFEDLYELIDGEPEIVRGPDASSIVGDDWGFTDGVLGLTNARLQEFYDECDRYRFWVEW